MSQAQEILPERELDQADPLGVLTTDERAEARRLIAAGATAKTAAAAAAVLGGSFLLYRTYMHRRLLGAVSPTVTRVALETASDYYWRRFFPAWVLMTSGALSGAGGAMLDTRTGDIPPQVLQALGEDYAERLGPYLHDSSKIALTEGFSTYVNKKLPRQMAAKKAIESYGLSQRQARALAATKPRDAVSSVRDLDPEASTRTQIRRGLASRARSIGEQESYSVAQEGKQLGWLYQIGKGRLPEDVQRMWLTARDERVCTSCGPMHRVTVPVTEPFDTPMGTVWTPSLHPNCRCEMVLKAPAKTDAFIKKDLYGTDLFEFNQEHPRGAEGRFRTKTKEAEAPASTRIGGRIERAAGRVGGRVSSRIEQAPAQTEARVETGRITLPRVEAARLVEALVQTRVTPVAAPAVPEPKRDTKTSAKTKTVFTNIVPLDQDMYLISDLSLAADTDRVQFSGESFTSYNVRNDEVEAYFDDLLTDEAHEIVDNGRNIAYVAGPTDPDRVQFQVQDVRNMLETELYGDRDNPLAQHAREMGFHREDHTLDIYVIRAVNADESTGDSQAYLGNREVEVGGDYAVEDVGVIDSNGFPVRYVWLEPIPTSEDEELD